MKRLLIVIDYQNDFVNGALGFEGAELLEDPIVQKIKEYRDKGDLIAFTYDTHHKDYLHTQEGAHLPVPHCIEGTPGHGLFGKVADCVEGSDRLFFKPTFGSSELFERLLQLQQTASSLDTLPLESIELVGLVSHICVLSNAVIARTACPNVPIIVDATCTDSYDKELQEKAFDVLEGLQITVKNR